MTYSSEVADLWINDIMKIKNREMKLGRKLAEKSNKKFTHSVIILKGGSIISTGYNRDSRHAEDDALDMMFREKGYFRGTILISMRVRKDGTFGLSKPCQECWRLMRGLGVSRVIYYQMGSEIDSIIHTEGWVEEKV